MAACARVFKAFARKFLSGFVLFFTHIVHEICISKSPSLFRLYRICTRTVIEHVSEFRTNS